MVKLARARARGLINNQEYFLIMVKGKIARKFNIGRAEREYRPRTYRSINLRPLLMQVREEYGIPVDDWENLMKYKGECIKVVRWESPVPGFHLRYRFSDLPHIAIASFDMFEKGGIYRLSIRETIPYQKDKTSSYKYDTEVKFYSSLKKQLKKRLI